jgi:hypothetical protein
VFLQNEGSLSNRAVEGKKSTNARAKKKASAIKRQKILFIKNLLEKFGVKH